MFKEIHINNFRGLKESRQLRLAPLTIFTGPEGSGKSSIGHFLTMLKQTVHTADPSVVLYPGDKDSPVKLGTQSSLLHNDADGPLQFSYRFSLPAYLSIEDPEKDQFGVPTQFLFGESIGFHCTLDSSKSKHPVVERFVYELYDQETKVMTAVTRQSSISTKNTEVTQFAVETSGYLLKNKTGRPWLKQPPIHFYGFSDELKTYYKNIDGLFKLNAAHENLLSNIYYVGSDRTRFNALHLWSGGRRFDVGHNGSHTINALLGADGREISLGDRKRNQPIQMIIRDILKQLNLVHDMHVEDLEAIEDGYAVKITARKSKQIVDLTEAGRAVTQVLPILVQCFCAPRNSIIVLDAIETHLSVQTQALLADVLLDVIRSKEDGVDRNIQLLISTHSEAFLRRLQRRVAEGGVPTDTVQAYHTNNYRRGVDIQPIPFLEGNQLVNLDTYFTFADDDRTATIEVNEQLIVSTPRSLEKPIKPAPKKIVQASTRGPGRPKGSKNKIIPQADSLPKRRPGRPKGSKNKPKNINDKPKRGPGRPKGSKNKNSAPVEVRTHKDAIPKEQNENLRAKRLKNRHADRQD